MKDIGIQIRNAYRAFIIGDVLGVPVEFFSREELKKNPVINMREYGTHNQPKGTWSDDTSLMMETTKSLIKENAIKPPRIMEAFCDWMSNADLTANGKVFDIGTATSNALTRYKKKKELYGKGTKTIVANGNGSLMRMLPISLFVMEETLSVIRSQTNAVAGLTHGHKISLDACFIYNLIIFELMTFTNKKNLVSNILKLLKANDISISPEVEMVLKKALLYNTKTPDTTIKSSGYVIDSLDSVLYCFLTTSNTKDAILKAVNLGGDTDTIAAITGSLAGIVYTDNEWINELWKDVVNHEMLDKYINQFIKLIKNNTQNYLLFNIL